MPVPKTPMEAQNVMEVLFEVVGAAEAPRPAARVVDDDEADPRGPHYWRCGAGLGRRHDISMRRVGGTMACWYCGQTRAQLQTAHDARRPA